MIGVNVVSSGLVERSFLGKIGLSQEEVDAFGGQGVQQAPLGRPGKPEKIAKTVAFLDSEDARCFHWSWPRRRQRTDSGLAMSTLNPREPDARRIKE